MVRDSEKEHWNRFWAASQNLDDVYGTDGRIPENLAKYADLPNARVLEVGAGTGRDCEVLASRGAQVCALDYSEESLGLIRRAVGDPMGIVCGDAFNLPFASDSFDVVFHQGLLEHFRKPGPLLDENIRVLKSGGILLVDVPQRYHYYTILKHVLMVLGKWFAGWETEFSVGELTRLIEEKGMEVVGVYGHNMSPPIWYRGLRRVLVKSGLKLPMYPKGPPALSKAGRFLRSLIPDKVYVNTAMVIGCVARKP